MKIHIRISALILLFFIQTHQMLLAQQSWSDSMSTQNLPSIPFLPDPLIWDEGGSNIPITTPVLWQKKRDWIWRQYQHWISGTVPPPPDNLEARILSERVEQGVTLRMVELSFGTEKKARMTLELMIPPSEKPLPVFLTQWNHRGWAQIAVRRGYIGCVFAGADVKDDTRNYNKIFSGYNFSTLMKRAWGASRVIDYLVQLSEVDTACIGITGHSRNGKQSLMAAALDNRIKAVISSSGGTGGESTFRWSDDRFTPGSFDRMLEYHPDWFSDRLPWFIGRENKLPVDQNSLMSLIAPRGLMMVSAITEDEGNPWGVEQSYQSVKKVYQFLKADQNIAILLRQGRHQQAARDIENFLDFFDYIFKRSSIVPQNQLYYDYSFEKWKQRSGERINPLQFPVTSDWNKQKTNKSVSLALRQDNIKEKIKWLLGEEPPGVSVETPLSSSIKKNSSYPDDYLEEVIGMPSLPTGIKKMTIGPYSALGENLWGNIYFPPGTVLSDSVSARLPLVIFLHKYAYATGYRGEDAPGMIKRFTEKGFAVLALDMAGFGTRIEEALFFYNRYPHWSLMGKMVADTRMVISDVCTRMPFIDSKKIYLAGYSLGGTVALLTAALDSRVKGVAVVSAFSSLKNDIITTEGIRHFAGLHGLIPRLGFFIGHENRIPVDFDEVLSCIVPRRLLIIAPQQDRNYSFEWVKKTVASARLVYAQEHAFDEITLEQPDTFSHFPDHVQQTIANWLAKYY